MFNVFGINYLAVILASIIAMVIGMIWYGPLFGKRWMELSGLSKDKTKSANMSAKVSMVLGLIRSIVVFTALALVLETIGKASIKTAFIATLVIWVGFVLTTESMATIWEGKSKKLLLINSGYNLVALVAGTIILIMM